MTPEAADGHVELAAVYVHVPFCRAVCPYCAFAVVAGRDDLADRYFAALQLEISRSRPWRRLDAVHFGGGTPSHVPPAHLGRVLEVLEAKFGFSPDIEVSLEANPEDFAVERAFELRSVGFNRVSFGAQSLEVSVLRALGRRHQPEQVIDAVLAARSAGIDNLSLDLIFGTPGETDEMWIRTVTNAIEADPGHISCYGLTVERGTPLARSVVAGAPAPDPDIQADRYQTADELLASSGYHQYEVSNWSRPGRENRYNLTVWAQGEYEAFGNGAHGHRDGVRYRNHRRVDAYISAMEEGRSPRAGQDVLDGWDAELDRLFVGLRRRVGVAVGPGTQAFLDSEEGAGLFEAGLVDVSSDRLLVRDPLFTDTVHRSVLALSAPIVIANADA